MINLSPFDCKWYLNCILCPLLEGGIQRPDVVASEMDAIQKVIKVAESDGLDRLVRRQYLEILEVVDHIVKVYLTPLLPTNLSVHDAATPVEAHLPAVRH